MTSLNGICGNVEIISVNYHFRFLVWHVLFDSLFKRFFSRKMWLIALTPLKSNMLFIKNGNYLFHPSRVLKMTTSQLDAIRFMYVSNSQIHRIKNAFLSVLLFWWIFEICFKFFWEWKSGILYTWHEYDRDVSLFFREISQLLGSFPDFTNFTNFHDWSPLGVISLKFRENRENTINFDAIFSHKNSKRLINSTPLTWIISFEWQWFVLV